MSEATVSMADTVTAVLGAASEDEYYITKSFSWDASWRDVLYDFGVFLGSLVGGMLVYILYVRLLPPQA